MYHFTSLYFWNQTCNKKPSNDLGRSQARLNVGKTNFEDHQKLNHLYNYDDVGRAVPGFTRSSYTITKHDAHKTCDTGLN